MMKMKNKPFTETKGLNWLQKSLITIIVLFIIVFSFGIYVYNDILNSKNLNFEETKKVIINQTPIKEVKHIERFHGDEAYHVVYGVTENEDKMIIFYPLEGKEKNITTVHASEIVTEEEMYREWLATCDQCELINITPAIDEDTLLWEITYYDENDRYVLDYFSIQDGSSHEQFRFKKMFN